MTPILEGHPPQNEAFSNQNKGHLRVPGIYTCHKSMYHTWTNIEHWSLSTNCRWVSDQLPPPVLACCDKKPSGFHHRVFGERLKRSPGSGNNTALQKGGKPMNDLYTVYGRFQKNRGNTPKMDGLSGKKKLLELMIWGKPTIFGNI